MTMYAGDEFYDDDVTSGIEPQPLCTCERFGDFEPVESHAADCVFRRAVEAVFEKGYPA